MRKANTTLSFTKKAFCVLLVFMIYFGFLDIARQPSQYFASVQSTTPFINTEDKGFSFQYAYTKTAFRSIQISCESIQSFCITEVEKVASMDWLKEWKVHFTATPYASKNSLHGTVSMYLLVNGDTFVHYNIVNDGEIGYPIRLRAVIWDSQEQPGNIILHFPFEYRQDGSIQVKRSESAVTGNQMCYIQVNRYHQATNSFLFSPYFHYSVRPNGLVERADSFFSSESFWKENVFSIEQRMRVEGKHIGESWFIASHHPIMQIESAVTQKYLATMDFNNKKIFTRNGFYYKSNQEGFLGETKNTYYWDYSMYGMKSLMDFYNNGSETLPYDLSIISLYALLKKQNKEGYWSNQTISLWLQEKYGIRNSYYDTRFNIDAGLFALQMYEKFGIPEALHLAKKQGNLLMSFIQKGYTIPTRSYGYLICDYICFEQPTIKTHASLNHLLNEALFLRQLSRLTQEECFANSAKRIENGIKATEQLWYNKKSRDLNYCIDSNFKTSRTDYPLLTYHDFLRLIRFHEQYTKEDLSVLIRLASFKENWLVKKNLIKVRKITKTE